MSIETWKEEFYPVKPKKGWTTLKCLQHSLRKWEGALPKNTKRHGVYFRELSISEGLTVDYTDVYYPRFHFDNETCALCVKFQRTLDYVDVCGKCPLNNNGPKDFGCGGDSVYAKSWYDPKPMIRALKAAIKKLEQK